MTTNRGRGEGRSNFEGTFLKNYPDSIMHYEVCQLHYESQYIPDFMFRSTKDDHPIYLELKGYLRAEDRTKLLSVVRSNPGIDLRVLLMRDNKLTSTSKFRYSDWCKRHGILYHVSLEGYVPPEWLEEFGIQQ